MTIFWRIYLPLGMPGVAVSAIFSFIFSWNELLYALVLITSQRKTAPVIATNFMSGYELPWGKIMATGTLIVLPVTIFALLVSRHMVRGSPWARPNRSGNNDSLARSVRCRF